MLRVNEIFLSIQGEGISAGYPTVFVRLTGCNLRCNYCDTTYSYSEGVDMNIEDIIEKIEGFGYKRVCLTGGEPLLQRGVKDLLERAADYELSIETNGSIDLSEFMISDNHRFTMDIKTPSSGESDNNYLENFDIIRDRDEIKIVIGSKKDYDWAKDIIIKYYKRGNISFSPMYGEIEPSDIVGWILEDKLDIRFQIQIHKFIWNKDIRGV